MPLFIKNNEKLIEKILEIYKKPYQNLKNPENW